MTEKPDMSFLNKAVDYTIKRIKEAGEKVDSKELKGAMSDEQFKAFMKGKEDEFLRILLGGK